MIFTFFEYGESVVNKENENFPLVLEFKSKPYFRYRKSDIKFHSIDVLQIQL